MGIKMDILSNCAGRDGGAEAARFGSAVRVDARRGAEIREVRASSQSRTARRRLAALVAAVAVVVAAQRRHIAAATRHHP
jgi:hypothetical protein